MADTTKLTAPNGVEVSVTAEKAERLLDQGFTKPKSTRKAAASESSDNK